MITMREALEKLTNAVGQLEKSQAHSSPPDTEVESLVRTKTKCPPTRRTPHFSRGKSSRSQTGKAKSKEPEGLQVCLIDWGPITR